MKKQIWIAVTLAIVGAACADGALAPRKPDLACATPLPPTIVGFTADPIAVQSGESVKLFWETIDATQIQIVSSNPNFSFDSGVIKEQAGSVDVYEIKENTTFVLTASKPKPAVDEEGCVTEEPVEG